MAPLGWGLLIGAPKTPLGTEAPGSPGPKGSATWIISGRWFKQPEFMSQLESQAPEHIPTVWPNGQAHRHWSQSKLGSETPQEQRTRGEKDPKYCLLQIQHPTAQTVFFPPRNGKGVGRLPANCAHPPTLLPGVPALHHLCLRVNIRSGRNPPQAGHLHCLHHLINPPTNNPAGWVLVSPFQREMLRLAGNNDQ